MHHGSTLLLVILLVLNLASLKQATRDSSDSLAKHPDPPKFTVLGKENIKNTTNAFGVGGQVDMESAAGGTVAHALGDKGVKKHVENLKKATSSQWEKSFVLDYSLFNYRKSIAKMTQQCIKMMEALRDDMVFETSAIVDKEVERVWPLLEQQGDMKKVADTDKKNGLRGPWYIDKKTHEKVDQSFILSEFYPKKPFWRNYLEHQLHRADHEVMSSGADPVAAQSHSYKGRAEDFNRASNQHTMLDGTVRPHHGAFGKVEDEDELTRAWDGSMAKMAHHQDFHDDETVARHHVVQNI